jgi:predicted ATP-grasp superfamily ATP-dependent carboligase
MSADDAISRLQACVLKPRYGAGAEGIRQFSTGLALRDFYQAKDPDRISAQGWIVQPYQLGVPASMAMLAKAGQAWLLACNQQHIDLCEDQEHGLDFQRFAYAGWQVNGLSAYWQAFSDMALQIARAMPELTGYVGVDMILNGSVDDCQLVVLEINPRLTTPYAALRRSLGVNPASLLLDLFYNPSFSLPPLERHSEHLDT